MKELVVISGKGGTGKTSIVASLASLAENKVVADCDVDAADLHLVLNPEVRIKEIFKAGKVAVLNRDRCCECEKCIELCRFNAISDSYEIDNVNCEGCGVCAYFCPYEAIEMKEKTAGEWYVSDTRHGPLVHARLGIAEDNSGKLVSKVREEAVKVAEEKDCELIIIDGAPGVGCPVIASITGSNLVLIVIEPTVSGIHDLKRVLELIKHFRIRGMVCINKCDLNKDMTEEIKKLCSEYEIETVAKIPYDTDFTRSQIEAKSIIEYNDGPVSEMIRAMWDKISNELKRT